MSLFLEPDEENFPVTDEQTYTLSYPSTPSSLATNAPQDLFDGGNAWAAVCTSADESYCNPQPMAWPSQHSLSFPSTQTSTQSMTIDPMLATYPITNMPGTWPLSSAGILMPSIMPSSVYREDIRHDSIIQSCYPQVGLSGDQPMTMWNPPQSDVPQFRPVYDMSPGQSEYSVSSQASCVASSSPYAHSEECYPARHSPMIKVEEDYSTSGHQLYSISNTSSPRTQQAHVSPGDIFHPPDHQVDEKHPATPPSAPVKVEEDAKPVLRPSEVPALTLEERRQAFVEERRKRGYTTPSNAVCSCEQCGKLFQRMSNLKAHMDTHKPDREQPWACHYSGCGRRFVRRTDLTRHQESVSCQPTHLC